MTALAHDTVTLLTDFGTAGGAVGVLHSVIRQFAPGVGVVDLSHEVAPFDTRGASVLLARSVQYLCPGVILVGVDPTVGTGRRLVAIEVAEGRAVFVGPDNGVLAAGISMLGGAERAVCLDNSEYHLPTTATTASSRDVLAPVAGHLCSGVPLSELGSELDPAGLMPGIIPIARHEGAELAAEVLSVDRFGNLQLNLSPEDIELVGDQLTVIAAGFRRSLRIAASYEAIGSGLALVVDADGLITVCANRSSAAEELGLGIGDPVTVTVDEGEGDAPASAAVSVHLGPRPKSASPSGGIE